MRYLFILFMITVVKFTPCSAQTLKVQYAEKMDLSKKLNSISNPMIRKMIMEKTGSEKAYELISQNGVSVYQKTKSNESETLDSNVTVIESEGEDIIYMNHKENIYIKQTEFMSRTFLIKSNIQKNNWTITEDTLKIGDYLCKKATIETDGSTTTAWFTGEIPSNNGPRDYYGLPGLILKVKKETLIIEATDISFSKNATHITKPSKGKEMTKEAFKKMQKEKIKSLTGGKSEKNNGIQVIKM